MPLGPQRQFLLLASVPASSSLTLRPRALPGPMRAQINPTGLASRLSQLNEAVDEEEAAKDLRKRRFIIDPESVWYSAWVGVMTLAGFYSCIIGGYQMAFYQEFKRFDATLVVEYLIDILFLVDFIANFFVSFFIEVWLAYLLSIPARALT